MELVYIYITLLFSSILMHIAKNSKDLQYCVAGFSVSSKTSRGSLPVGPTRS